MFASWPYWFDAARYEWSCARGPLPHVLEDTAVCARCRNWTADGPETTDGAAAHVPRPAAFGPRSVR